MTIVKKSGKGKTIKVVGYGKSSCYHFLYAADRDTTRASNQFYYVKHGAGCDMGKVGGSKKTKTGILIFYRAISCNVKLAPNGTDGRLLLTANFKASKSRETKIKNPAQISFRYCALIEESVVICQPPL